MCYTIRKTLSPATIKGDNFMEIDDFMGCNIFSIRMHL